MWNCKVLCKFEALLEVHVIVIFFPVITLFESQLMLNTPSINKGTEKQTKNKHPPLKKETVVK